MKNREADADEFARARLAYLTARNSASPPGPRRASATEPPQQIGQPLPATAEPPVSGDPPERAPHDGALHDGVLDDGALDDDDLALLDVILGPAAGSSRAPGRSAPQAAAPAGAAAGPPQARGPAGQALDAWQAGLPAPARSAVTFARGHLVAVAAVLLVGVLVTAAFLLRSRASQVPLQPVHQPMPGMAAGSTAAAPTGPSGGESAGGMSSAPSAASTPVVRIEVHVLGDVVHPGVVSLPLGARVQDAIVRCGGMTGSAAAAELNLAAPLADGDQVVIGTRQRPRGEIRHAGDATAGTPQSASDTAPTGPSTGQAGATTKGSGGAAGVIDLNRASAEQLDQLPGVGPVTAQKILAWRTEHHKFTRVEELQEVDGIGPKTYAQLSSHVRV